MVYLCVLDTRTAANTYMCSSCNLLYGQLLYPPAPPAECQTSRAHTSLERRARAVPESHTARTQTVTLTRYTGVDTVNRAR